MTPLEDVQISLNALFNGETLTVGDKLFFDWELLENRTTSGADPGQTLVAAIRDDPDRVVLRFDGRENSSLYAQGNELIDYTFRFKVRALDPAQLIKDVGLSLRYHDSSDIMSITEFVYDPGRSFIDSFASLEVGPGKLTERQEFEPRDIVVVEKRILLGGGIDVDDTFEPLVSYIHAFGQEFSQVPEPGTAGLSLAGAAIALYHRSRGHR